MSRFMSLDSTATGSLCNCSPLMVGVGVWLSNPTVPFLLQVFKGTLGQGCHLASWGAVLYWRWSVWTVEWWLWSDDWGCSCVLSCSPESDIIVPGGGVGGVFLSIGYGMACVLGCRLGSWDTVLSWIRKFGRLFSRVSPASRWERMDCFWWWFGRGTLVFFYFLSSVFLFILFH